MRRESVLLLNIVLALLLIGILTVYSASTIGTTAAGRLADPGMFHYLKSQGKFALAGLLLLFYFAHFDYHRFQKPLTFRLLTIVSLAFLGLVFVPGIGKEVGGAWRWIGIGSFRFQPSELAKLALVVLLAVKLSANQKSIQTFWQGFVPPLFLTAVFTLPILVEPDLGIPVVMWAVAIIMTITAGVRWRYPVVCFMGLAPAVLAMILATPYRRDRMLAYLDPWTHREGKGFHLIQSLAAFAQGGIWGRGPGAGEQKLAYLPAAHTDFIFAVWAEEMGLIGTLALLLIFVALLIVGIRIALCARDLFGSLLATGIIALISLQAAFNMAVTMGLLPTKGLALPFISAGGSALIVNLAMAGILLNIGLQAQEPQPSARTAPA